jgi:hypothetical protein
MRLARHIANIVSNWAVLSKVSFRCTVDGKGNENEPVICATALASLTVAANGRFPGSWLSAWGTKLVPTGDRSTAT